MKRLTWLHRFIRTMIHRGCFSSCAPVRCVRGFSASSALCEVTERMKRHFRGVRPLRAVKISRTKRMGRLNTARSGRKPRMQRTKGRAQETRPSCAVPNPARSGRTAKLKRRNLVAAFHPELFRASEAERPAIATYLRLRGNYGVPLKIGCKTSNILAICTLKVM